MSIAQLILANRADIDQKTYFEDYECIGVVCSTCYVAHGPMRFCRCGNIMCEACVDWNETESRVINFNPVKRMRKLQRYVLEPMVFNSFNCNKCKKVVGLRL